MSKTESFSAFFPGVPAEQTLELGLVRTHLKVDGVDYSVFSEPLASGQSVTEALAAQRAELDTIAWYNVLDEKPVSVGPHPGIELKLEVRMKVDGKKVAGLRIERLVATKSRKYEAVAETQNPSQEADARKFVESFQIR